MSECGDPSLLEKLENCEGLIPYYEPLRCMGLAFVMVWWAVCLEFVRERGGCDRTERAFASWHFLCVTPCYYLVTPP